VVRLLGGPIVEGAVFASTQGLVPIQFTDARIHAGSIGGWLDVSATSNSTGQKVQIHRLIFDEASTTRPTGVVYTDPAFPEFVAAIPEPGSNLALLALGAGGLTLRRRLKRAT